MFKFVKWKQKGKIAIILITIFMLILSQMASNIVLGAEGDTEYDIFGIKTIVIRASEKDDKNWELNDYLITAQERQNHLKQYPEDEVNMNRYNEYIGNNFHSASKDTRKNLIKNALEYAQTTPEAPTKITTKITKTSEQTEQDEGFNLMGGLVSVLAWIIRVIPVTIANGIGKILSTIGAAITGQNLIEGLTLDKILFNEVELTSIDFFSTSNDNSVSRLRDNVAIWYVAIRNLSAVALAIILLYVGVRMAISSVAEDKAKYKKMLFNWVTSLALLFLLHYIMIAVIGVNNSIVDIISEGRDEAASSKYVNTMNEFAKKSYSLDVGIIDGIAYAFIYLLLSLMTFIFLLTYIKRMITIAFLIIIAPIITITYSIDKMGDGKSQALNAWLKEFVYNVLIQCFHCIIYLSLVQTSFNMLKDDVATGVGNAVLAFLMVVFMYQAEDIVKNIFGFKASSLPQTIGQAAVVATAVSAMGKAGKSASSKGGGGGGGSKKNPRLQNSSNQSGNSGNGSSGNGNTGNGNAGNGNTGNGNTGNGNTGNGNTGNGNTGNGNTGNGNTGNGNMENGNPGNGNSANKKSGKQNRALKLLKAGARTSVKLSGAMVGLVAGASTGNLNAAISGAMAIGGATSGMVDNHDIKAKQRRIAKTYNDFEQEHSELDEKSRVEYSRMLLDGDIEAKTDAERNYVDAMRDLNDVYERNGNSPDDAGDKIEKVIKRVQDGDISETSAPRRYYNSAKQTGKNLINKVKSARNRNNTNQP